MDYHEFSAVWKRLLEQGLDDDAWLWDWTTLGTSSVTQSSKRPAKQSRPDLYRASIRAKADGVWACAGLVAATNLLARERGFMDNGGLVTSDLKDGARVRVGQIVARFQGPARLVLALERPFLNLAQYACGIATATRELVDLVEKACPKSPPRVTATRKTLPGYRDIAISALRAGGGVSHRVSLSGGVLIKENHVAAAGGIARAIEGARAVAPHGLKIEIEVRNARELEQALAASAEVVMLDNFSPSQVRTALKSIAASQLQAPVTVEVSGGIHAGTIASYALPGVHVISVGSLTHSVRALDLSMLADGIQ